MNLTLSMSSQADADVPLTACQAAIFEIAGHWLALPAIAITKVLPSAALSSNGREGGLKLWKNHPVDYLDLETILASAADLSGPEPASTPGGQYVLMVGLPGGKHCAIPVHRLPMIESIQLSTAQVIPSHYRQTIHNIAEYMVVRSKQDSASTILLLDVQQALQVPN